MLRYTVTFFLAFLAAIALVASTNYGVDANYVYGARDKRFARSYVERLRGSEGGLVLPPLERGVKLELARQSSANCIVLGSSHVAQLGATSAPQIFGGCEAVVNLCVSGGSFEDLVAALGVIIRRNVADTIFIGIGPWMLRRHADERFAEERKIYQESRNILGLERDPISFSDVGWYTNLAREVRGVGSLISKDITIKEGQLARDDEEVMKPDGTWQYSRKFLASHAPRQTQTGNGDYKIASPAIDPSVVSEFERVITLLVQRGVTVKFLLMPYHPAVMSCLGSVVCLTFDRVEGYVRDLGKRFHLDVIGSYDPRPFDLTWSDYLDEMHLRKEALTALRPVGYNPFEQSK
jgi:hypothetical protein